MRIFVNIVLLAVILSTFGTPAIAGEETAEPANSAPPMQLPLSKQLELQQIEYFSRLAELQEAFANERHPEKALDLQRQITAHKLNYEIELFRTQLDHFRTKEDTERSAEIEATIEALEKLLAGATEAGSRDEQEAGK